MHRYCLFSFIIISYLIMLVSCKDNTNYTDAVFSQVENIAEQYPDSALYLLGSIHNPKKLDKERFAQYFLYLLQAKVEAKENIASDTLIFQVRDYYLQNNRQEKLVLAEFYSGCVLQSQQKQEEAMQSFLMAKEVADKTRDIYWSAMADFNIGRLNYKQYFYKEARPYFKSALQKISTIPGKYKIELIACNYIANTFLHEEVQAIDSTLFYERKSLEIAILNNDLAEQIKINHFIGITLLEGGDISGAKEATFCAMTLSKQANSNSRLPRIYGHLANIYQKENKIDSALYYAKMALMSTNDNRYKSAFYETLSNIEESRGNFQKSLEYLHLYVDYADSLYSRNQQYNILEIQKKYNFELIQNANRKLIIEKLWTFIALIISVLILIIILFYIYRKRTLNKEAMLVARQQIYQLKEMISKREKEENDANKKLRDALYEQLDIIKKVSLLESFLGDDTKSPGNVILRKVNKIIYKSNEDFDWSIIFQSVNALYEDFLIRLKNRFPALTEDEVLICCLLKIGFNNEEIGLLLKSGTNFAQKKKTSIRKKIGMKKQEHFMKQLDDLLKIEY